MSETLSADAPAKLRSFIERIEFMEKERKELAEDVKGVFGEVKSAGFDVPVVREIIKIRGQDQDKRIEHGIILDLYLVALGMN